MALRITESWIRQYVKLKHDNLDDIKSLSLPGTYNEKISSLGTSLCGFTRLKSLDLSRNTLISTEGLESLNTLESLNLYYNNISSLKDLYGLRNLTDLKDLDIRLNPVTKNEPDYRLFLVHMLPNLRRLDDRSVRDSERRAAIMHFISEQASEFDDHFPLNSKNEADRAPLPRSNMIRNLGSRRSVLEDDDVAVLDLISRTGGDLTQPHGISGSTSRAPDIDNFSQEELAKMYPMAYTGTAPTRLKSDSRKLTQNDTNHMKDRVYVRFADDDVVRSFGDPNLKYRDESDAYSTLSTRGHFTPNPRAVDLHASPTGLHSSFTTPAMAFPNNGQSHDLLRLHDELSMERLNTGHQIDGHSRQQDSNVPLSARSHQLSPAKKKESSPRPLQGPLAGKIGKGEGSAEFQVSDESSQMLPEGELLRKLLDLVDKYWNGSKSLHQHTKFQSLARKLLSSHVPTIREGISPVDNSDKLEAELAERTGEISRLRDQMAVQQRELEQVRSKLKTQEGMKDSLDAASKELVKVQTRLQEFQEENNALQSKITALAVAKQGASEQERIIGELQHRNVSLQEQVKSLTQQVQQQTVNLQQLQELTNMLQESHRSLVSTNDHLLQELELTRQRHQHEVHQMHWSYDNLKKTIDWIPNSKK